MITEHNIDLFNERIRNHFSSSDLRELSLQFISQTAINQTEINRRCHQNDSTMFWFLCVMWGFHNRFVPSEIASQINKEITNLISGDEFIELKKSPIAYDRIINSCSVQLTNNNPKFNIIVPVRNRNDHLISFLQNSYQVLKNKEDWAVTVIFQEDNDKSFVEHTLRAKSLTSFNINFIDMPHDEFFQEKHGGIMNRSLCYNVVSKMISCDYQINHDVDLLFQNSFIDNIENRTNDRDFQWLQPYRGSRVIHLPEDTTKQVKTILNMGKIPIFNKTNVPLNKTPNSSGAPGGSIVVKHMDFKKIGGYDPELVWGYSPEDILFWLKLEVYFNTFVRKGDYKTEPFCNTEVFSHNSDVELFHMYHPPTEADKRYPYFPLFIASWLMNCALPVTLNKWLEVSYEQLK